MFLLRRSAARALSASSKAIIAKPRSITNIAPQAFRVKQQQWALSGLQRRYLNDEAENRAATGTPDGFAQTAAEAPVDETVTPAAPQAEPTEPTATVGVDALESAAGDKTDARGKPKTPNPESNILYVGNLFYEVTEDQLRRIFSRFGTITKLNLVFDNRGLSRGFAYVEFQQISEAKSAMENLDMQVFEGRNLVVQFHRPREGAGRNFRSAGGNPPSKTLFIGNMPFEMSDKDLSDLFREIRNVMDVRVAIDRRTGQPRGFAHADFIDIDSATQAKAVLQDKALYGRQLRVDFSLSNSDQPRRPSANAGGESTE